MLESAAKDILHPLCARESSSSCCLQYPLASPNTGGEELELEQLQVPDLLVCVIATGVGEQSKVLIDKKLLAAIDDVDQHGYCKLHNF